MQLPDAAFVHLYVAKGSVDMETGEKLNKGDAARLTGAGALKLTANVLTGSEVLIWEMAQDLD